MHAWVGAGEGEVEGAFHSLMQAISCAGVSQLMASVLTAVFCNPNCDVLQGGIALHHPSGDVHRLWIKLGMSLNDGAAHKLVHGYKGDSGCRFCSLCLNAWCSVSPVVDEDGEPLMVCRMFKVSEMKLANDNDILGAVDRLAARALTCNSEDFAKWEKAAGIVHQEHGLLQNQSLRSKGVLQPATQYVHDPMHCFVANGVMNVVVWLLLTAISADIDVFGTLRSYIALWAWPKNFKLDKLFEVFNDARVRSCLKAKRFKCMASELLGLYPILAYFFQSIVLREDNVRCLPEILAFLALCDVMDLMQAIPLGIITPEALQSAIESFLAHCVDAKWENQMIKKFHWLLHMPSHLLRFKFIPTCFALERKHRLVKRFVHLARRTMALARSTYRDVLNHELAQLKEPNVFRVGCYLVEKHKPTKKVHGFLSEYFSHMAMDMPAVVHVCRQARIEPSGEATTGDIVLIKSEANSQPWDAGEVWMHVEFEGHPLLTIATMYSLRAYNSQLYAATWDVQDKPMFVYTADILCGLIHKRANDGLTMTTLIPVQFR